MESNRNPDKPVMVRNLPISLVDVSWLRPFEGNAKLHPPEQVERLAASIRRFGFNAPVLALPDGTLVAGHGRLAAAVSLGLAQIPCVVLHDLTPEEARAYTLADNRIGDLGEWDEAALEAELISLGDADPSLLADAGFSQDEVTALLNQQPVDETELDEPETPPPFTCPHCGRVIGDDE